MFQKHPYGVTVTNIKLNAKKQPQEYILHHFVYGQVKITLIYSLYFKYLSPAKKVEPSPGNSQGNRLSMAK